MASSCDCAIFLTCLPRLFRAVCREIGMSERGSEEASDTESQLFETILKQLKQVGESHAKPHQRVFPPPLPRLHEKDMMQE